jgi:transposase
MIDTIGVDISKDTLDACWFSKRKHNQFSNNKAGLRALIRRVPQAEVSLVVFEGEAGKELIQ